MRGIFVALLLACSLSRASVVTFVGTDFNASSQPLPNSNAKAAQFDAAVVAAAQSEHIFDFEGNTLGNFSNLNLGFGLSIDAPGGSIQNSSQCPEVCGFNTTSGGSQFFQVSSHITFNFATPVDAFGFYITGVQFNDLAVTFDDGTSQSVAIPNPGAGGQFIGFTDFGKNIFSATINLSVPLPNGGTSGDVVGFDDIRIGFDPAAVPEPSTVILIGAGLLLVFTTRRWLVD